MPDTDRDRFLGALRERFTEGLPARLSALEQGLSGLRARPQSETNRTALERRVHALREAALALELDPVVAGLGDALIALEGPDMSAEDLDLLGEAMATLRAESLARADRSAPAQRGGETPAPALAEAPAGARAPAAAFEVDEAPAPAAVQSVPESNRAPEHEESRAAALAVSPQLRVSASSRHGARRSELGAEILRGRKVLVADDDPAVLWCLGNALRAADASVIEARNGLEAWEGCLREPPDLVMSDLLMPALDGYSLCRNLKRDVVLRDVPVILLSRREDLLQRARELGAGADGYLSKDCDSDVIIARCAEALAPTVQLDARLESPEILHGRLDGVTPRRILGLVARAGADRIVEFCDAGFAYEAHFSRGALVAALRRGAQGVQRGDAVLSGLLGMRAGRFIVRQGTPRASEFSGSLEEVLRPHQDKIRAACALVLAAEFARVERLELDERVLAPYIAASPPVVRELIDPLLEGAAPRSLERSATPALFEQVLVDLALRGGLLAARDESGLDLLRTGRPLAVDAKPGTPAPVALSRPAGKVPAPETGRVVFSERLTQSRLRHEELQAVEHEPQCKAAATPELATDRRLAALAARMEELFDGNAPIELSSAVLAGVSLTPIASVVDAEAPSSRRRSIKARIATNRLRTPLPPVPESGVGTVANEGDPIPLKRRAAPRPTLVSTLAIVSKGWDLAKGGAEHLAAQSRRWLPSEASPGEGSELSAASPQPGPLPDAVEKPSAAQPDDGLQVARAKPKGGERVAAEDPGLDADATDPDWLPPVDNRGDASEPAPSVRRRPDPSWVARVAAPLALVSVGGYAAFSLVGALSSALPNAALEVVARRSAAPQPSGEPPETSAAQALLDDQSQGGDESTSGGGEQGATEESSAEPQAMHSRSLPLPQGVTLSGDKGLLEVNSGGKHKLYVGGVFVGRGPARRIPLSPGQHEVRIRLGSHDATHSVQVETGQRTRLEPRELTAGR